MKLPRIKMPKHFYEFCGGALLVTALLVILLSLGGCASAEKVAAAEEQASAAELVLDGIGSEIAGLIADLDKMDGETAARTAEYIQSKQAEYEEWAGILKDANSTITASNDAWGWAEAAAGALAAFIPGAGVAVPMIRRSRNAFENTVAVIAAGGGPKDPDAANAAQSHYPGLKAMVTAQRVKIGDKEIKAVRT